MKCFSTFRYGKPKIISSFVSTFFAYSPARYFIIQRPYAQNDAYCLLDFQCASCMVLYEVLIESYFIRYACNNMI